ncbi:MAG TPA: efflux RND transporter periplasmic adaptor subunit [Burkholderiaceae bacterium]|nr:efflux RND transporter periplasmic adaptor subunit [Burkholderiaceae bacterium]
MRPIAAALVAGSFSTLFLLTACDRSGGPTSAQQAPPEVGVLTVKPRLVVMTTVLPGRTSPTLIAEVRPQVTGIIQKRAFDEGTVVKAGSTLYRIDPATYQTAYESARAAVAKAEAGVQTARRNLDRLRELVAIKFVSQQAYDDAAATLRQNEADLEAAKAAAEAARINLGYTNVVAPIGGRIGKSTVTVGALVTANQSAALVTIQQLDPIYVDVTQSTTEALALKREMASGALKRVQGEAAHVKLLFEDGTTYAHEGTLQFSDVTVDPSTGAITLRALFPNPEGLLLPNMYVRAVIEEGVRDAAILVPQQAVTRDAKGQATALVVGADGKVAPRVLQTARTLGRDWLIDAGLQAGDRVIVEGVQRARPGAPVKAVEIAAAGSGTQAAGAGSGPGAGTPPKQ